MNVGLAKFAFKFRAASCAVDTGFSVSAVFVTLSKPTIDWVIPNTVPVKVGFSNGAFKPIAVSTLVTPYIKVVALIVPLTWNNSLGVKPLSPIPTLPSFKIVILCVDDEPV